MKKIYFLIIVSLVVFAPYSNLFAENEEPYTRDEEMLQSDELPPVPALPEVTPPAAEVKEEAPQPEEKPVLSGIKTKAMDRAAKKEAKKQAKIDEKKQKSEAKKQAALEKKQAALDKKQAKIDGKKAKEQAKEEIRLKKEEARREEEKLKVAEVENKRIEKEIAQEKALEEARAKKAEIAKLEQELEQKRLTDVERRERLYKKIGGIEEERNTEYLKKHGTAIKQEAPKPASPEKNMPEDVAELMKKGDDLYNSGDYDRAREHYDKARFLLEEKNKGNK